MDINRCGVVKGLQSNKARQGWPQLLSRFLCCGMWQSLHRDRSWEPGSLRGQQRFGGRTHSSEHRRTVFPRTARECTAWRQRKPGGLLGGPPAGTLNQHPGPQKPRPTWSNVSVLPQKMACKTLSHFKTLCSPIQRHRIFLFL